jgi:predicted nucleic acid-binding protein
VNAVVIDASVAIKWVVPEPFTDQATTLLAGPVLCAPAHWHAEAVNGVWKRVYRGELSAEHARSCARTLIDAPVKTVPLPDLIEPALNLAIRLRITVYDALYVALAEVRRIPLVSDDRELLKRMAAERTLASLAQPVGDLPP